MATTMKSAKSQFLLMGMTLTSSALTSSTVVDVANGSDVDVGFLALEFAPDGTDGEAAAAGCGGGGQGGEGNGSGGDEGGGGND